MLVMGDGWLRNPEDGLTYRFHRDEKEWAVDPTVFVDMSRAMPGRFLALLKILVVASRQLVFRIPRH